MRYSKWCIIRHTTEGHNTIWFDNDKLMTYRNGSILWYIGTESTVRPDSDLYGL